MGGVMMHQITVDKDRCRGPHCCYECETVHKGLVEYCAHYGRVLVSWPSTATHSDTISRLIAACPDRAIVIKPFDQKR